MNQPSLRLLGGFQLLAGSGQEIRLPTRRSRALLAYLALSENGPTSRGHLADLLLSRRSEEQSRHSLSQCLLEIRKVVKPNGLSLLSTDKHQVALDRSTLCVDVWDLEAATERRSLDSLCSAVESFSGPILDDLTDLDPVFDEWRDQRQSQFENRLRNACVELLDGHWQPGDRDRVVELAQRLLALDPYDERAHRALMRVYADRGQLSRSFHQFNACRELLKRDLHIPPSAETLDLKRKITPIETTMDESALEQLPSVAVLRFDDRTGEEWGTSVIDEFCEDIVHELSSDRAIHVIASDVSLTQLSKTVDPASLSSMLGARYFLAGALRFNGKRITVLVRLVSGETRRQLWSSKYTVELHEFESVREEIVAAVTAHLRGWNGLLHAHDQDRSLKKRSADLSAYDHALRGHMYKMKTTQSDGELARYHLEKAVQMAPTYAWAHAWKAWVHFNEVFHWWSDKLEESQTLALDHARRAVALDPMLDFGHWSLASAKLSARQFDGALSAMDTAMSMYDRDADSWVLLGTIEACAGRCDAALSSIQRSREFGSTIPDWHYWEIGTIYFLSGDYLRSIETFKKVSSPNNPCHLFCAASYAEVGELELASAELTRAQSLTKQLSIRRVKRFSVFRRDADLTRLTRALCKAGLN